MADNKWTPQPKVVAAGGIGTILTGLLAWVIPGLPPGLAAALASLITGLLAYLIPNPKPAIESSAPTPPASGDPHIGPEYR